MEVNNNNNFSGRILNAPIVANFCSLFCLLVLRCLYEKSIYFNSGIKNMKDYFTMIYNFFKKDIKSFFDKNSEYSSYLKSEYQTYGDDWYFFYIIEKGMDHEFIQYYQDRYMRNKNFHNNVEIIHNESFGFTHFNLQIMNEDLWDFLYRNGIISTTQKICKWHDELIFDTLELINYSKKNNPYQAKQITIEEEDRLLAKRLANQFEQENDDEEEKLIINRKPSHKDRNNNNYFNSDEEKAIELSKQTASEELAERLEEEEAIKLSIQTADEELAKKLDKEYQKILDQERKDAELAKQLARQYGWK